MAFALKYEVGLWDVVADAEPSFPGYARVDITAQYMLGGHYRSVTFAPYPDGCAPITVDVAVWCNGVRRTVAFQSPRVTLVHGTRLTVRDTPGITDVRGLRG